MEPAFLRQYKKIGHVRQASVNQAIADLVASGNPAIFGKYKKSTKVLSYEIGRADRLIYSLDYSCDEIVLLRVGDHKTVYGRG